MINSEPIVNHLDGTGMPGGSLVTDKALEAIYSVLVHREYRVVESTTYGDGYTTVSVHSEGSAVVVESIPDDEGVEKADVT